jgi:aminopeptidase N
LGDTVADDAPFFAAVFLDATFLALAGFFFVAIGRPILSWAPNMLRVFQILKRAGNFIPMYHAASIRLLLASVALALPVSAMAQDARAYRPGVDVLDYAITIEIPDTGAVIQADALLTIKRTARVDTLVLDLMLLRVAKVLVDERQVTFGRTDSTILIPLPRGEEGTTKVRVTYGGAVTDGLIARRDTAGRWTYFGDNWPNRARYWIPSVDHPSDKATVSWNIRTTRKRGRVAVGNGAPVETFVNRSGPNATNSYRYRSTKPISTYLMVIAVAPMISRDLGETACGLSEIRKCVRQQVFVAPEQWGVLPGAFAQAGDIVKYFASIVAPFPYERLSHFQSSTRFGGMENATVIFYSDRAFRRGGVGLSLIAHEVAHQWFGDAVTQREWPHLWLSEGFATYFAALYTGHARGETAFKTDMRNIRETIISDTGAVLTRPVIDTVESTLTALLNRNSYDKGGFVLHMLRARVGDSAFFRGVRDYYNKHKHGNALTADLQAALEKSSGRPLGAFFDQWLRRPGYPELDVTWSPDSASQTLEIGVTQARRFGAFEFSLRLALTMSNGQTSRLTVTIPAQPDTRVMLPVSGVVTAVEVDPDVQLLARITTRKR